MAIDIVPHRLGGSELPAVSSGSVCKNLNHRGHEVTWQSHEGNLMAKTSVILRASCVRALSAAGSSLSPCETIPPIGLSEGYRDVNVE
jgi:hypothetical protein